MISKGIPLVAEISLIQIAGIGVSAIGPLFLQADFGQAVRREHLVISGGPHPIFVQSRNLAQIQLFLLSGGLYGKFRHIEVAIVRVKSSLCIRLVLLQHLIDLLPLLAQVFHYIIELGVYHDLIDIVLVFLIVLRNLNMLLKSVLAPVVVHLCLL